MKIKLKTGLGFGHWGTGHVHSKSCRGFYYSGNIIQPDLMRNSYKFEQMTVIWSDVSQLHTN